MKRNFNSRVCHHVILLEKEKRKTKKLIRENSTSKFTYSSAKIKTH